MISEDFYKDIIENSQTGYAYSKIICDEKGIACDYEFIEVNKAFEDLTGLERNKVIGKTVTNVLPGIKRGDYDWVELFGEVALKGAKKQFEEYSEPLGKWYRVNAFSNKKGYFITTFVDISKEKEQISGLNTLLETSQEYLLQKETDLDYQKITDRFLDLTESKFAAFNLYNVTGKSFTTVAISGDRGVIKKASAILGIKIENKKWEHDTVREEKLKNNFITRFESLDKLTGDVIPKSIVSLISKSFGIGQVVVVRIKKENKILGDFTLIMPNNKLFNKDSVAKIYSTQLGLVIEKNKHQEILSKTKQEYIELTENIPGIVFRCLPNKNWTMIMMSEEVEKITGYPADVFLYDNQLTYESIVHREDAENLSKKIQASIRNKKSWDIEYRIMHKNGSVRWVKEKGRGIRNEKGEIAYLDGIILDITKQKELERKLRESEQRFKTLFNDSPVSILLHDKDTGEIIDANEKAWKAYGLGSLKELQENEFWAEPPYSKEDALGWIKKASKEGMQIFEWKNRKVNGKVFWEQVVLRTIMIDGVKRILSTTIDITYRKEVENKLFEKQKELDTYFTSSLDFLCIANTKGEFVRLNPEWEKVLGYPLEELEGKLFLDYVHPEDVPSTLSAIKQLEYQQEVISFTNRYRCTDGSYRWIEWRSKPVGEMIYAVARDVTNQRQLEEKLRSANNLLDSTFNAIQDGISVLNTDLTIKKINQKMSKFYGEENVLVGRYCYEAYQNRKTPCDNCPVLKSMETKKTCSEIVPMIVDGQQIGWLEVFAYPMIDSSTGNVDGVVEFVRDITQRKKTQEELLIKSHVLDQIQDTVTVTDLDGNILYVNLAESKTLGYSQDELNGLSIQIFDKDQEQGTEQQLILQETLKCGMWRGEVVNKTVDDKEVIYDTRTQIITDNEGNKIALAGVSTDITLRKEMEKQIADEKQLFKTTLLSVGDGIISTDESGKVIIMNVVAEKLTGWTQEEALGKHVEEVFYIINEFTRQRCDNPVQKVLDTGEIIELANHTMLISKDGIERPIEDSAAPIKDDEGNITGVVLVFRDFTEKKKSLDEIEFLSLHDHLTGLYNRRFFEEEMKRLNTQRNLPITIIMGDVNGLKLVNDSFGHSVGDELLVKSANALNKSIREDDIIARVGGDEYAILLPKTDGAMAAKLVSRMKKSLANEKVQDLELSVSFGWETKNSIEESMTSLLKKAEDNMYNNKLFEGPSFRGKTINNILATINEKSPREKDHSERVSNLCLKIGEELEVEKEEVNRLKLFGLFHDIGNIAIDDGILNKPGPLTEKETKEMQRHSEIGYRILSTANGMPNIAEDILHHHERWDGNGYPKGIAGKSIPLFSRICAIADAYDAITSERSYRAAMTNERAIEELRKNSGTQFDPEIMEIFLVKVLPNLENGKDY